MMTATDAPLRSAAFICAFMLRPSNARSAERPARRSCSVTASASPPPVVSTTNTSSGRLTAAKTPFVVAGDQRAVETDGEADARRRRSAERLDQSVVAAAAAERVLGAVERAAGVLERRTQVVVEPADEPRLDPVRDAERVEAGAHDLEVRCRVVAPEVGERRCGGDQLGVLAPLGVEHAQRVALERLAALGTELVTPQRRSGRRKAST